MLHSLLQERKQFTHLSHKSTPKELEQINTDTGRYYKTPAGVLYPSVTSVTGLFGRDAIQAWRKRVGEEQANKISGKATRRGTRIHQLCEDYINGNDINSSKYSLSDYDSFKPLKEILDEHVDNIHLQETRLYSDYLQMAGTVDCIGEFAGKLSVIDFKTATKPKDKNYILNYFCQASAYAIMYEELFNIPVGRIVIIVSVDDDFPQIFVEKRDNYVEPLLEIRKKYKEEYGI